jgi:shikimate kinase
MGDPVVSGALVLIGLSGSGKSTVGRVLSARLDLPLIDTDRLIEELAGKSVAAIFGGEGEDAFRDLEEAAVAEACALPAVVAAGGGAVLRAANREAMRRGNLVVWLDLPPAVLAQRLATHTEEEERPLLRGGIEDRLRTLWEVSRPLYEEAAHLRVDGDLALAGAPAIARHLCTVYEDWRRRELEAPL